jgi:HK97 family phage prohead protease
MENKKLFCELTEVKLEAGDANNAMGVFSGYASVWNSVDKGGDQIKAGAYAKTIQEWNGKGMMPQMLFYHDMEEIIGEWTKMVEDEKGLYVEGRLWIKGDERIEAAVKAYNILKSNSVRGLSIGYRAKDFDVQELQDGGRIRVLKEIDLLEVSIAPWAMEPKASVTDVKAQADGEGGNTPTKREVEKVLRDAGFSRTQSKAFISGGFDAAMVRDEPKQADLSSVLASLNNLSSILKG